MHQVTAQDAGGTPQAETLGPQAPISSQVIEAINTLRMSRGIPPLGVHPVLMQIGQMEAEGIAGGMGGHWRPNGLTLGQWLISLGYPLSGDLSMDGYRSENWGFAQDAPGAVSMWLGDDEHSNTMLALERSDIGVGIAPAGDGSYVVVVETALQTKSGLQQTDAIAVLTGIPLTQSAFSSMSTQAAENGLLPQDMFPVVLNTALADGNVYHEVKYGQTLWSVAVTYGTTIKQLQQLNGLVDTTVQTGQKLLVVQHATQPVPVFTPQIIVLPTKPYSTQVLSPTATPVLLATAESSMQNKRQDMLGVIAIGVAALFLGGLFAVITKKKPI